MSIRSDLITQLTTNLTGLSVSVNSELPYESSGAPLFDKNRNVIYVDDEEEEITELYRTLDSGIVNDTATIVFAYFTAENAPVYFPGAPFVTGAVLVAICLFLILRKGSKYTTGNPI